MSTNTTMSVRSKPKPKPKPIVVGLYGIPGSGKTAIVNALRTFPHYDAYYQFFEGLEVMGAIVPGGLDAFTQMDNEVKRIWRQKAIDDIQRRCQESERIGIVTGQFMLWADERDPDGKSIFTESDRKVFTHILYLDIPASVIAQRCRNDKIQQRPFVSVNHLQKWQDAEKAGLRRLCLEHGIMFTTVSWHPPAFKTSKPQPNTIDNVDMLLQSIGGRREDVNWILVWRRVEEILPASGYETVLLIDGDKTLAPEDTDTLFWDRLRAKKGDSVNLKHTYSLKELFNGPLRYSYEAFHQMCWLYEEHTDAESFKSLCGEVASQVTMYPEFISLLHRVAKTPHVRAIVVTCGLRLVWENVLRKANLLATVKVVGSGREPTDIIVTPKIKGNIARRLTNEVKKVVWAFGDSPMDMGMLRAAHHAVVVVGPERTRSTTMEESLREQIIEFPLFRPVQVLLAPDVLPRLETVRLDDETLVQSILAEPLRGPSPINPSPKRSPLFSVRGPGESRAAQVLMTPHRDARVAGPALREAHRRIGWYLATQFVTEVAGLEEFEIRHVHGHKASGFRLRGEARSSIIAMMRGGESMALGVSDAFPLARFFHASGRDDIKAHQLDSRGTLILVDSVINTGKSLAAVIATVRALARGIRIVVVAGVIQEDVIHSRSLPLASIENKELPAFVALRISSSKFKGSGKTDTGNRLFNTTHVTS